MAERPHARVCQSLTDTVFCVMGSEYLPYEQTHASYRQRMTHSTMCVCVLTVSSQLTLGVYNPTLFFPKLLNILICIWASVTHTHTIYIYIATLRFIQRPAETKGNFIRYGESKQAYATDL